MERIDALQRLELLGSFEWYPCRWVRGYTTFKKSSGDGNPMELGAFTMGWSYLDCIIRHIPELPEVFTIALVTRRVIREVETFGCVCGLGGWLTWRYHDIPDHLHSVSFEELSSE